MAVCKCPFPSNVMRSMLLLNISNLDESIRDVLQKSLNESRNLSIATFEDTLAEDQCDLMVSFPRIEINIDEIDLDVDTVNDVSEVIEELGLC